MICIIDKTFQKESSRKQIFRSKGPGASHLFGPHLILGLETRVGRGCGSTKLFWRTPKEELSFSTCLQKEILKNGLEKCPKAEKGWVTLILVVGRVMDVGMRDAADGKLFSLSVLKYFRNEKNCLLTLLLHL